MKSRRGLAAAVAFLLALPAALLWQGLFGGGAETVIHAFLAVGAGLLCSAVQDFRVSPWATGLGRLSTGLLAAIFAMQGASLLIADAILTRVAFEGAGQDLEGWLLTAMLVWFMMAVRVGGRGRTLLLGWVAVSLAMAVRAYATLLPLTGASLESTAPALKLSYLLPFVWLAEDSRSRRGAATETPLAGPAFRR